MYLDVNNETGSIKLNFPGKEPDELEESCTLDLAERDGITLEEVGRHMNLTRERIRQLEALALMNARKTVQSDYYREDMPDDIDMGLDMRSTQENKPKKIDQPRKPKPKIKKPKPKPSPLPQEQIQPIAAQNMIVEPVPQNTTKIVADHDIGDSSKPAMKISDKSSFDFEDDLVFTFNDDPF